MNSEFVWETDGRLWLPSGGGAAKLARQKCLKVAVKRAEICFTLDRQISFHTSSSHLFLSLFFHLQFHLTSQMLMNGLSAALWVCGNVLCIYVCFSINVKCGVEQ